MRKPPPRHSNVVPMFPRVEPDHAHLADQLPAEAYGHLVRTLRRALPPPPRVDPGPEDLIRRDQAAVSRVAALAPGNVAEADVAAQFVAVSEQWKDCLRLAQLPGTTPAVAVKWHTQAAAMMHQANAALALLLSMQQARRKLEADPAARDRALWAEHCAIGLMAAALAAQPKNPAGRNDLASAPPPNPQPAPAAARPAPEPDPAPGPVRPDSGRNRGLH